MGTSIKINTILLDFYIKMLYICEIKLPKYMNYIYALVDTSKEVNIITPYGIIKYQPFYIGKGIYTKKKTERYNVHYFDAINFRNINPNKERKIRKLLKSNSFSHQILYENIEQVDTIEIELINLLGRKCVNKTGILTNISEGGTGGYVWKNNPVAIENIRNANKDKWKNENNPNSSKNRKFEDTPSHIASINGEHWNKGKFKQLYQVYNSIDLNYLGCFNSIEIFNKFDIKLSTLCASVVKGKNVKRKYYIKTVNSDLRIRINRIKKYIDDGIVRPACIIWSDKEYAEIDRNSLSPLREE